jgi:hypothetical protein
MTRLSLVEPVDPAEPPRPLGEHGRRLWDRVQAEFGITDIGGIELLAQVAGAVDRLEELAAAIAIDGVVIRGQQGAKANPLLRDEIQCRAFVVRTLKALGVTLEPAKQIGRPGRGY